jgi:FAD/FMN-containing dehydrogenase
MTRVVQRIPGFEGDVLGPADAGYEEARKIWNGMIDRRPALIARCLSAADVAAAIRFGRREGLALAVRSGGHGVAGYAICDGGLVIDLSRMRAVSVDPDRRVASAQAGALWGEVDAASQAKSLATTGGIVTHTGIAGLTLGGGIGWLMRKHGLSCDNLLRVELVTAEGESVGADENENADLFWGLRGGGGNFGVVTRFHYRLHHLEPTVLAGLILHAAGDAVQALRFYRDFIAEAPDELAVYLSLRTAPALPIIPVHLQGKPVVGFVVCYAGPVEEGERVLRPLRRFGSPAADLVAAKPYITHQSTFDPTVPHGMHYYWKSHYLPPLSDSAIDTLVEHAWAKRSPFSYTIVFHMGGAVRRADDMATAFTGRDAEHAVNINAEWLGADDPNDDTGWARKMFEAVQPHGTGGVYVNFLGDEGEDRVRVAYGAEKYERLARLKAKYDPANVFRLNQNIRPTPPTFGDRTATRT